MRLSAVRIFLLPLVLSAAAPLNPVQIEASLQEMRIEIAKKKAAGKWDEVIPAIQKMSKIDPIHPKPYIEMVLFLGARGSLADAAARLDKLGPKSGPGRDYAEAMLQFFTGKRAEAAAAFDHALFEYTARHHLAGQAACHTALGKVGLDGNLDTIAAHYEAARELLLKLEDSQGLADVLGNLSEVERKRGRPREAVARGREALDLRKAVGTPLDQAQSWNAIGLAEKDLGNRDAAAAAFGTAIGLWRGAGDLRGEAMSLREVVAVLVSGKQYDKALQMIGEVLPARAEKFEPKLRAELTSLLAETYVAAGRPKDAIQILESAAAQYAALPDPQSEGRMLGTLGQTLSDLGDFARARPLFERAIEAAQGSGDRTGETFARTGLGNLDFATGELGDALIHQQAALEIHRELGDGPGELANLANLGSIYLALGHPERSRSSCEAALSKAQAIGDATRVVQAQSNLGDVVIEEGSLEAALSRYEAALQAAVPLGDRRIAALVESNVADVQVRLGRLPDARTRLAHARGEFRYLGDRAGEAAVANVLGELERKAGRFDQASAAHRQALEIAEEIALPVEEWRGHAGLAATYEAQGKLPAAARETTLALDRLEGVRANLGASDYKMRFLAKRMDLYEAALRQAVPVDASRATAETIAFAFEIMERARARSLLDLMAESRSQLRSRIPADLRQAEKSARDAVVGAAVRVANAGSAIERATARGELAERSRKLDDLETEIHRQAPGYADVAYPRVTTLAEAQRNVLRDGEAVLEYFVGERQSWLLVLERDKAALHALPPAAEISRRVAQFLQRMEGADLGSRSQDVEVARLIADAILPKGALPRAPRLLIVPDGPLHHVAFDALQNRGRFIVETHETAVVPSITTLALMRKQPAAVAVGGWLGVGEPVSSSVVSAADLPLPHSAREIASIAALFPESERRTLLGAEATKARLLALPLGDFRILHFATHGFLDSDSPRSIGLRLSPPQVTAPADLLAMDDILALPLRADLVVLSACKSGLGESLRGEGFVGLTRSFLFAGTRQVVATLADVGDRASADFMLEFYRAIREGETPPAALRRAKLAQLSSDAPGRRQLRAWAPFVVVGDPGTRAAAPATRARAH